MCSISLGGKGISIFRDEGEPPIFSHAFLHALSGLLGFGSFFSLNVSYYPSGAFQRSCCQKVVEYL